jgi:hypothetical protein
MYCVVFLLRASALDRPQFLVRSRVLFEGGIFDLSPHVVVLGGIMECMFIAAPCIDYQEFSGSFYLCLYTLRFALKT